MKQGSMRGEYIGCEVCEHFYPKEEGTEMVNEFCMYCEQGDLALNTLQKSYQKVTLKTAMDRMLFREQTVRQNMFMLMDKKLKHVENNMIEKNVTNIVNKMGEPTKGFCFLERMVKDQVEFQDLVGNGDFPRLDGEKVADFSLGLISELGEVLQEYKGWKSWKFSDHTTYNKEEVKNEVGDLMHHFVNLLLSLDLSYEDIKDSWNVTHIKNVSKALQSISTK